MTLAGLLLQRIADWWAAWKWIAALCLLLLASCWLNVWQYGSHREARASARAEALAETLQITAGIARKARADSAQLLGRLDAIAVRGERVKVVYRDAALAAPLADGCAPGQGRVDAINEILGPATSPAGGNR